MARNSEKRAKSEKHTEGTGIQGETVKNVKYEKYTQQNPGFWQEN